ncbi:MAG: ketoacyl-ACP synthase III [Gammaproteobacteria bacterium]|nr:ketoacyl-ACP synthase III [Gammaproteobacteria bacterium]
MNSKILGTGSYLPKNIVTNHDLERRLDTSHDWIVQRTGIHQRHIADQKESVAFMATKAAEAALKAANLTKEQLDQIGLIIVASCSGESVFPSAAGGVQKNLLLPECPAFDLSAACAGFIYALSVADAFIKTNQAKYALVIGSEVMSRVFNPDDRSIAVLFGDGAGAVLLGQSTEPGIIATKIHADGNYDKMLSLGHFYARDRETSDLSPYYIHMDGKEVFKIAVTKLEEMVENIVVENGFKKSDLNWLVPHQANYRIIKSVAKRLDLPEEQVILTVAKHANTSAASIPLALDCGVRDQRVKPGDLILLESFGGGLAWGSALIRY